MYMYVALQLQCDHCGEKQTAQPSTTGIINTLPHCLSDTTTRGRPTGVSDQRTTAPNT